MWCSNVVVLVSLMVGCGMMDGGGVGCGAGYGAMMDPGFIIVHFINVIVWVGYRLWWG